MKTTSLFSKAVQLMEMGYSIMPVGLDKTPLLKSWKKYQTTRATFEEIEHWWQQFPNANIGIITGKVSGISVIDVDTYKGGDASVFPKTFTVRTGNGGVHLYYKYYPGLSISADAYENMPGVDIRSDGGYIVAAPSKTNYTDKHTHEHKGGEYVVISDTAITAFPHALFPETRKKRSLSSKIGVSTGGRNDSITSFIGQLLASQPIEKWDSEVWPAVQRVNKTYVPPLNQQELERTFKSIREKEESRRSSLILSPFQVNEEEIQIKIKKSKAGIAYNNMANVLAVLKGHPFFKDTIRYNTFRQEIEYNGKPIEDSDLFKIQHFMQTDAELHNISKDAVYAAVHHYAYENKYDEAQDWLMSLSWDGTPRLASWVSYAARVEDSEYHRGIGSQWFMGMIRRIMEPGCTFDHVLLLIGKQGIGKTSFFRILGGAWYKSYTGAMDNKDFYLALRGAMIVDLDEGAALYRSEAIKIKSIITETHDEYRAPYDRLMKKYPRRFVFSMSTNDTEPFRDATGNRRYWAIDAKEPVNFKWLEQNRDQLFSEAFHYWKEKIEVAKVPEKEALESQEAHLPEDSWTDLVMSKLMNHTGYREGNIDFYITIPDLYSEMFPKEDDLLKLSTSNVMRIAQILKKSAGLEKRRVMIEGERASRWMLTPDRIEELKAMPKRERGLEEEFDI